MISDNRKAFEEWAAQDGDEKPTIDRNGRYIEHDLQLLWEGWDAATQECQDDEEELERRPRIILAPVWQIMKAKPAEAIPMCQLVYSDRHGATAERGTGKEERMCVGYARTESTSGNEYVTVSMLNMDVAITPVEDTSTAVEPRFPEGIARS